MLTHIDAQNRPGMVYVGSKSPTRRIAVASAKVFLPASLAALLRDGEISSPKGPVFNTAILAGIMGAKRTSELIPLCHPLPLDSCKVELTPGEPAQDGSVEVLIRCRAETDAKTGVEMEAITGASIAAITLYDMGKAVTHGIVIREVKLLEKTGGKSDYRATEPQTGI